MRCVPCSRPPSFRKNCVVFVLPPLPSYCAHRDNGKQIQEAEISDLRCQIRWRTIRLLTFLPSPFSPPSSLSPSSSTSPSTFSSLCTPHSSRSPNPYVLSRSSSLFFPILTEQNSSSVHSTPPCKPISPPSRFSSSDSPSRPQNRSNTLANSSAVSFPPCPRPLLPLRRRKQPLRTPHMASPRRYRTGRSVMWREWRRGRRWRRTRAREATKE